MKREPRPSNAGPTTTGKPQRNLRDNTSPAMGTGPSTAPREASAATSSHSPAQAEKPFSSAHRGEESLGAKKIRVFEKALELMPVVPGTGGSCPHRGDG